MKKKIDIFLLAALLLGVIFLLVANLSIGEADIPFNDVLGIISGQVAEYESWSYIVENRLNRSLTAVFGGGALAVSGLLLQVFFRNPLAGPGVLGITSGASLGVALVVLGGIAAETAFGSLGIIASGVIGAVLILLLLLFVSRFVKNQVTLLVIGLMLGYFTSAFVSMLFLWADQTQTREFVLWGLGSFEGLSTDDVMLFIVIITAAFILTFTLIKGLNALVLGEDYAKSLGVNFKNLRILIILVTSILAAIVTVFCGPVSFIGIAVPQLVRVAGRSRNHAMLIPLCFLGGAFLGILADILVRLSDASLPLNTVTALIGAPIIIWTIIKLNRRFARM